VVAVACPAVLLAVLVFSPATVGIVILWFLGW
jgi:hypothetical protein